MGNKSDLKNKTGVNIVPFEEISKFTELHKLKYFEGSAKENINV